MTQASVKPRLLAIEKQLILLDNSIQRLERTLKEGIPLKVCLSASEEKKPLTDKEIMEGLRD